MGLVLGIIIGLLVLMALVVVHEFGHFLAARRAGIKVEEFGIGFPPRIWSCEWGKKGSGRWFKRDDLDENGVLKSGGLLFSINLLPIGGFCKMQGEADAAHRKGDYGSATFGQKSLVLFGGIIANFLAAALIFTILSLFGMPKIFDNQFMMPADTREIRSDVLVATVVEGSPADQIGIKTGYELTAIAGQTIESSAMVSEITKQHANQEVEVEWNTPEGPVEAMAMLTDGSAGKGYLGVSTYQNQSLRSTWSAPIVGAGTTVQFTYETVKGLGSMMGGLFSGIFKQFSGDQAVREAGQADIKATGDGFAGPLAIVGILLPEAVKSGALYLLFVAGVISVSLAIMNLLPIPALDGGRWLLTAIFRWLKKPLTLELESKINAIGFMLLMGLMILITVLDIGRLGGA